MTNQTDIRTFDDFSQKFSTWIIKYCSATYEKPLFLVWYTDTDENNTDRLLTFNRGDIFAIDSLTDLKEIITTESNNLVVFDNLNSWLSKIKNSEPGEIYTYDINSLISSIAEGNLTEPTLDSFTNFINLYRDFVNQDEKNSHLTVYSDNKLITETWNYFYDFIFWPRQDNKKKFNSEPPELVINTEELVINLKHVIRTFEEKIKVQIRQ